MDPKKWGKCAWEFIHNVLNNYPLNPTNNDKKNYKTFFISLGNILPCGSCNMNYKLHYAKLPLTDDILSSRDEMVQWGIDLHNLVNIALGKGIYTNKDNYNNFNKIVCFLISIIIVIIIVLFIKKLIF